MAALQFIVNTHEYLIRGHLTTTYVDYSIVKDSNVDLTVGNCESKIRRPIISNSSSLA